MSQNTLDKRQLDYLIQQHMKTIDEHSTTGNSKPRSDSISGAKDKRLSYDGEIKTDNNTSLNVEIDSDYTEYQGGFDCLAEEIQFDDKIFNIEIKENEDNGNSLEKNKMEEKENK
jgi:hypothetical protein